MPGTLLYLSRSEIEALDLPMSEIIEAVNLAFHEKALGRVEMPPKHWLEPTPRRFFSAMSSVAKAIGRAACKWQSGSSDNLERGLPYLTGLLILNDLETGLPIAVMDSTWLTAQRTAAASAVAARYLAVPDPRILAVLGCGVQGRTNLAALKSVFPQLDRVQAFDIVPERLEQYAREMEGRHGVPVHRALNAREAIDGADIVVTAGPIEPAAIRTIGPGWLKRGALGIALDYDCYWQAAAFQAADGFYTDDVAQLHHLEEYGYFRGAPPVTAEVGEVVAGLKPGRTRHDQVLIAVSMGVAAEDVLTAHRLYQAALRQGRGIELPL
ncbi:MAG: ornithine cyclodeaminase family protein [Candidatus Rokubacteria bacterium]|nr:ornithine cyclodeaminase family protein [Candidatus Rokubacteria bacterium]